MLLLLGAALALNFQVHVHVQTSAPAEDTTTKTGHHAVRPVTPELLATAFKDSAARTLLARARVARLRQDSALTGYDAKSYSRISVGMGFGRIGRDRLLYRHEAAGHVRWQRGVGAWVQVTGARTAIPVADKKDEKQENRDELSDDDLSAPLPYYPGYEPLWIAGGTVKARVDETEIVHPLAEGSEAYYTYQTGDSLTLRLPDKRTIRLRELKIRPRQPKWNLCVGSFWFDVSTGQLVRAAYRLSIPVDVWDAAAADTSDKDQPPAWVKAVFRPMQGEISAVGIEYGLYEGRFWLPTVRSAEGGAQVGFIHVPFKFEESFSYNSVNARDTLPTILVAGKPATEVPDTLSPEAQDKWIDSVRAARRDARKAERDSLDKLGGKARDSVLARRHAMSSVCDTADTYVVQRYRYDGRIPVAVRIPCNEAKLENSPDLPKSIYGPDDEMFDAKELQALKEQALALGAQAPLSLRLSMLPPPTITYGPSLMRYNRVEGFSLGASVDEQLGGGYDALALGRFGFADREPNVELTVTRTNLAKSVHVSGYNHLVSASDWGRPLSFGSSFSALMFGRDEGFYYRASGVELGGEQTPSFGGGADVTWRLFAEQQRTARVNTNFAVNGADFPPNFVATRGAYAGAGARITREFGLDPQGFRLLTDARIEAAYGDSAYGRAAVDLTASHGLGALAGAITLSGGSSVGALPVQRRWYLGGSQTIRGQSPDTAQSGNAFWMTRLELGTNSVGMRPTLFGDLGWVGDRAKLSDVGRPMSGVGAGVSFLDGLFRFDVARGLYPRKQWRVDLYLESRF
ncbi:MAG TPA: ShlB/FhaC/HecB family hemolysin secretion/activation protein [Gemmatimonadaceae bacterium]|nr:ShlB/FhaC/HecB family hemolysin secretion/activation protein [Gemmatimonadaceae bacterium]